MGPGAVGTGKGQDCGGSCITSKPGIKPLAACLYLSRGCTKCSNCLDKVPFWR